MTRNRSLRRSTALHRLLTLGLLAAAALAFTAAKAHAAGESITLTQNDPTAVAGRATNFTAAGNLNPDDTMFGFDIFVFLKDPTKDPTCASTFDEESATAMHSGGNETWISPATGFQPSAALPTTAKSRFLPQAASTRSCCGVASWAGRSVAGPSSRHDRAGGRPPRGSRATPGSISNSIIRCCRSSPIWWQDRLRLGPHTRCRLL